VGAQSEEFSDTIESGKIISLVIPDAGLKPGDVIDVVVSKGPDLVDVPNVVGWTVSDALAKLTELGFNASTNTPEQYWDTKVKSQSVVGPQRRGSDVVVYNPSP
jgi:serine/threonine-protein kinase